MRPPDRSVPPRGIESERFGPPAPLLGGHRFRGGGEAGGSQHVGNAGAEAVHVAAEVLRGALPLGLARAVLVTVAKELAFDPARATADE